MRSKLISYNSSVEKNKKHSFVPSYIEAVPSSVSKSLKQDSASPSSHISPNNFQTGPRMRCRPFLRMPFRRSFRIPFGPCSYAAVVGSAFGSTTFLASICTRNDDHICHSLLGFSCDFGYKKYPSKSLSMPLYSAFFSGSSMSVISLCEKC